MVHQVVVSSVLLLSIAVVAMISSMVSSNPTESTPVYKFYDCTQSSDCKKDECCVLGMMRYSTPHCLPFRTEGESCRIEEPRNMTVTYPNGVSLNLVNTYTVICPCDVHHGLECTQGTCQQSSDHKITNAV